MKQHCAWVVAAIGLASCSQILLDDATVVRKIHVAAAKAACPDAPARECYQISDGAGPWRTVDTQIAGFNYSPGTEYFIEVAEPGVSPQAGTGTSRWELCGSSTQGRADESPVGACNKGMAAHGSLMQVNRPPATTAPNPFVCSAAGPPP